jgi:hypothetical protein
MENQLLIWFSSTDWQLRQRKVSDGSACVRWLREESPERVKISHHTWHLSGADFKKYLRLRAASGSTELRLAFQEETDQRAIEVYKILWYCID